ncbi:MAG: T9SS type A sorting domain-containing protein [Bacteroidota bacterium]
MAQQGSCIDSLALSPMDRCLEPFEPKCGCDSKTYRNLCDIRRNGVLSYTEGSCSGYEFDIFPTYNPYYIYFTLVQVTPNFSRMTIVDLYGKLWWEKDISAMPREYFQIDITYLTPGPYIIYVYDTKGTYRWKKFVKSSIE